MVLTVLYFFFFYKATPLNVSLAKYVICIQNSLGFIVLVTQCSGSWPVSCTVHAWLLMLELWNVVGKYQLHTVGAYKPQGNKRQYRVVFQSVLADRSVSHHFSAYHMGKTSQSTVAVHTERPSRVEHKTGKILDTVFPSIEPKPHFLKPKTKNIQ